MTSPLVARSRPRRGRVARSPRSSSPPCCPRCSPPRARRRTTAAPSPARSTPATPTAGGTRASCGARSSRRRTPDPTGPQWQASGQGEVVAPERHADPQHHHPGQPERHARLRGRRGGSLGDPAAQPAVRPGRRALQGDDRARARRGPRPALRGAEHRARELPHRHQQGQPLRPHPARRRLEGRQGRDGPRSRPAGTPTPSRSPATASRGSSTPTSSTPSADRRSGRACRWSRGSRWRPRRQDDERQPDADGLDPALEPRGPQRPPGRRAAHPPGHLREGVLRPTLGVATTLARVSRKARPEDVDEICAGLPETELGTSWGDVPTWKVPTRRQGPGVRALPAPAPQRRRPGVGGDVRRPRRHRHPHRGRQGGARRGRRRRPSSPSTTSAAPTPCSCSSRGWGRSPATSWSRSSPTRGRTAPPGDWSASTSMAERRPRGGRIDPARLAALDVLKAVRVDDAYANLALPHALAEHGLSGRRRGLRDRAGLRHHPAPGHLRRDHRRLPDQAPAGGQGPRRPAPRRPPAAVDAGAGPRGDQLVGRARPGARRRRSRRTGQRGAAQGRRPRPRRVDPPGRARTPGPTRSATRPSPTPTPAGWSRSWPTRWPPRSSSRTCWPPTTRRRASCSSPGRGSPPSTELVAAGGTASTLSPYAVELPGGDPAAIPAVAEGRAGVQDEGSQLVALALAEAELEGRDERWLDVCAGPGGKSALLAALAAERGALLLANERQHHRARLVARGLAGRRGGPARRGHRRRHPTALARRDVRPGARRRPVLRAGRPAPAAGVALAPLRERPRRAGPAPASPAGPGARRRPSRGRGRLRHASMAMSKEKTLSLSTDMQKGNANGCLTLQPNWSVSKWTSSSPPAPCLF